MTQREARIFYAVNKAIEETNVHVVELESFKLTDVNFVYGIAALKMGVKRLNAYLASRNQPPQYPKATFGPTT